MKAQGIEPPALEGPLVYVAYRGQGTKPVAIQLSSQLRHAGIPTWLAFGERSLKSQMREANRRGVRYTLIIGEGELERQVVTVRDMVEGTQTEIALDDVVQWLTDHLPTKGTAL